MGEGEECLSVTAVNRKWFVTGLYPETFTTQPEQRSFSLSLLFRDRISPCDSSDCPGTRSVDQVGLEITEIHLSLPLGLKVSEHHHL